MGSHHHVPEGPGPTGALDGHLGDDDLSTVACQARYFFLKGAIDSTRMFLAFPKQPNLGAVLVGIHVHMEDVSLGPSTRIVGSVPPPALAVDSVNDVGVHVFIKVVI